MEDPVLPGDFKAPDVVPRAESVVSRVPEIDRNPVTVNLHVPVNRTFALKFSHSVGPVQGEQRETLSDLSFLTRMNLVLLVLIGEVVGGRYPAVRNDFRGLALRLPHARPGSAVAAVSPRSEFHLIERKIPVAPQVAPYADHRRETLRIIS